MSPTKRLLDITIAGTALIVVLPLLVIAAIGIKLASPGPILHRGRRIGRDRRNLRAGIAASGQRPERRRAEYRGREFTLYKFRTMRMSTGEGAPITAQNDARVFPFGALLRATKLDELPQLVNVIKGDMALVGPRPEAPEIVRSFYTPDDILTLQVPPGVTSPGSLYYYTHCESKLGDGDVTEWYAERLLPVKLAIDRVYIQRATVTYDIRVILRTIVTIVRRTLGYDRFPDPPELSEAEMSLASQWELPHRESPISRA